MAGNMKTPFSEYTKNKTLGRQRKHFFALILWRSHSCLEALSQVLGTSLVLETPCYRIVRKIEPQHA